MNIPLLDHGLPLQYLKSVRRELVEKMGEGEDPPTDHQLQQIANVELAIAATKAVIAEIDDEKPRGMLAFARDQMRSEPDV